jgi:hypothetical protein
MMTESKKSERQAGLIRTEVEASANNLFERLDKECLCLVHFLYGSAHEPGAVRESAIRVPESSYLEELGNGGFQQEHDRVLQSYVRYVDRKNTLVNTIENVVSDNEINRLILQVKESEELDPYDFDLPLEPESIGTEREPDRSRIEWNYGTKLSGALVPDHVNQFFEQLYLPTRHEFNDNWSDFFLAARAAVFNYEKELPEIGGEEVGRQIGRWKRLAALQGALLYFKYGSPGTGSPSASAIFVRLGNGASSRTPSPLGVAVIAPREEDPGELDQILKEGLEKPARFLETGLASKVSPNDKLEKLERAERELKSSFKNTENQDEGRSFTGQIKDPGDKYVLFHSQAQKELVNLYGLWMLRITELLQDSYHEGAPLSFFFIAGDESEFRDDSRFDFRPIAVDDASTMGGIQPFAVPTGESLEPKDIQHKAHQAARLLSGEHYPWFKQGRYALFWNVSTETPHPSGLISLKGSNWKHAAAEIHRENQTISLPSCLFVFTVSDRETAAAISVQKEDDTNTKKKKIERVLRWRDDHWESVGGENRRKELKDRLTEVTTEEEIEEIINLTLLVSDNPEAGGIILIGKEDAEVDVGDEEIYSDLVQMGRPWSLDDEDRGVTFEDRIALIGHDGASLRISDSQGADTTGDHWTHRILLMSNEEARNNFEREKEEIRGHLRTAGARRWSAALTALRKDIPAVIAISQDGDIQFWKYDADEEEGKLEHRTIYPDGTISEFSEE